MESPAPARASTPRGVPAGTLVLVADDEPMVLELVRRVLESRGLRVLAAETGAEAIRLFSNRPRDVALAVLDVSLPDMGGAVVWSAIRSLNPGLAGILVSGYERSEAERRLEGAVGGFLQKPFSPDALIEEVERLLGPLSG